MDIFIEHQQQGAQHFSHELSVQFSPVTHWAVGGDTRDDLAKIIFQSLLREVIVSSSCMGS